MVTAVATGIIRGPTISRTRRNRSRRSPDKPPAGTDPSIAPDVPKSDLVLRKLQDLLKDDKFTPNVEKQLGMTKDEAEQFVKKFEKPEQPEPVGPGREIKAKPGEEKVFDPNRKAPEFNTSATSATRTTGRGARSRRTPSAACPRAEVVAAARASPAVRGVPEEPLEREGRRALASSTPPASR